MAGQGHIWVNSATRRACSNIEHVQFVFWGGRVRGVTGPLNNGWRTLAMS